MNRSFIIVPVLACLFVTGCSGYVEERVVVREPSAVVVADVPPPPRDEIIVAAPSPRHHWEHGHWLRHGRGWIWIGGHWRA